MSSIWSTSDGRSVFSPRYESYSQSLHSKCQRHPGLRTAQHFIHLLYSFMWVHVRPYTSVCCLVVSGTYTRSFCEFSLWKINSAAGCLRTCPVAAELRILKIRHCWKKWLFFNFQNTVATFYSWDRQKYSHGYISQVKWTKAVTYQISSGFCVLKIIHICLFFTELGYSRNK